MSEAQTIPETVELRLSSASDIPDDPPNIPQYKPSKEDIEIRNKAFTQFWESIQHLQNDPNFERLPIPYNFNAIMDMVFKQITEEEGIERLTNIEIEKYNEIKEEIKERLEEAEESAQSKEKNKKKKNNKH
jgi:hypothetical protein